MRDLRKAPRRYSRLRLALFDGLRALARSLAARDLYAHWLARRGLQLVEVDVPVPDLPADLDGLRIVQLSDLHAGPFFDRDSLEPVVDLAT
jgi:predicted MPP superfamily phosphohydrolase